MIEEIAKRDRANWDEKRLMREKLGRETVEKENLFNNDPFNEEIKKQWEESLDRLHIWCYSDYNTTNSYIRVFRSQIGN